ncbi:MAG: hypothetical protein ONB16_07940 [candidate division KSB1 bacterium]|nr:hypothetical protein [candidate division KSB1 bacterium]MDZ7318675.1 hypothetical protein [candidate division KSB1 bacterium]MDZ7342067.1 hypothetical protein [candidate division KSB1 bacterium]
MNSKNLIQRIIFFITIQSLLALAVWSQSSYKWDKELVRKVTITDKVIIDKLVLDLFIPESDVDHIEIFDVDANGVTEGDLLRVQPSRNVYSLMMLSQESREIISKIPFPENTEETGYIVNINNPETPEQRILFILAQTIKALYSTDKPLKLYFEQYEKGMFRFEFFGFSRADLKDDPNLAIGKTQGQAVSDLLKLLYKEFNQDFPTWQPTVIHVMKIERDTLIVPEKSGRK